MSRDFRAVRSSLPSVLVSHGHSRSCTLSLLGITLGADPARVRVPALSEVRPFPLLQPGTAELQMEFSVAAHCLLHPVPPTAPHSHPQAGYLWIGKASRFPELDFEG